MTMMSQDATTSLPQILQPLAMPLPVCNEKRKIIMAKFTLWQLQLGPAEIHVQNLEASLLSELAVLS